MAWNRRLGRECSKSAAGGRLPWASLLASFAVIVLTVASAFVGMTIEKGRAAASGLSVNVKGRGVSIGAGEIQLWSFDNSFGFSSPETRTQQWPRYIGGHDGLHVRFHLLPHKFWALGKVLFALPGLRYETYIDGARGTPSVAMPSTWFQQRTLTVSGGVIILLAAAPWLYYQVVKGRRKGG